MKSDDGFMWAGNNVDPDRPLPAFTPVNLAALNLLEILRDGHPYVIIIAHELPTGEAAVLANGDGATEKLSMAVQAALLEYGSLARLKTMILPQRKDSPGVNG